MRSIIKDCNYCFDSLLIRLQSKEVKNLILGNRPLGLQGYHWAPIWNLIKATPDLEMLQGFSMPLLSDNLNLKLTKWKHLILPEESIVAAPLKVDVHVMAVTGLSPCWSSFRKAPPPPPLETSHSLTVHPAALRASGRQSRTPTTGPEWPVRVARGLSADPVDSRKGQRIKSCHF